MTLGYQWSRIITAFHTVPYTSIAVLVRRVYDTEWNYSAFQTFRQSVFLRFI